MPNEGRMEFRMATAYRIECTECLKGPYQCAASECVRAEDTYEIAAELAVAHTSTTGDHAPPPVMQGCEECACDSLESLAAWFEGFGSDLDISGFMVATVTVDGPIDTFPQGQVTYNSSRRTAVGYSGITFE